MRSTLHSTLDLSEKSHSNFFLQTSQTINSDCNDSNSQVWLSPVEAANLTVTGPSPTTVSWDDQGALAGLETIYDLVTGLLSAPGNPGFASAVCLQEGGPVSYNDTRPDPDAGGPAFWYLARARNSCGIATYGTSSFGAERSILACP